MAFSLSTTFPKFTPDHPRNKSTVHLIGIGGIGMSAIAEILFRIPFHGSWWTVQGSDLQSNSITQRLQKEFNMVIFESHDSVNITPEIDLIIISSSIKDDNPEVIKGIELNIPMVKRGTMLKELMAGQNCIVITGSHGKTTTTGLVGHLLNTAKLSQMIINGGIMKNYGSNVYLADQIHTSSSVSDDSYSNSLNKSWFIVEGDESDGTMSILPRTIAIITNLNLEHMEYYKTEEKLQEIFIEFIQSTITNLKDLKDSTHNNNLVVLCTDCPRLAKIYAQLQKVVSRDFVKNKIITYGLKKCKIGHKEENPDIFGYNSSLNGTGMSFNVELKGRKTQNNKFTWENIQIPLYGTHNVQNVLAAIAIANYFGLNEDIVRSSLASFAGIERRFDIIERVNGVTIINDYAHHPKEIQATLKTAKDLIHCGWTHKMDSNFNSKNNNIGTKTNGRLIVIHQPHRYTRVQSLFEEYVHCFEDADVIILTPIYSAGETPLPNISSSHLANSIKSKILNDNLTHNKLVIDVDSFENVITCIKDMNLANGDVILCCGAGNITNLAQMLPEYLKAL